MTKYENMKPEQGVSILPPSLKSQHGKRKTFERIYKGDELKKTVPFIVWVTDAVNHS